jgi:hypothetical protein
MTLYEFEIQNTIKVKIRMESKEEARRILVEKLGLYEREMMQDCCISDGVEVKET